jgi:S-adenosylmethionine decarboxylase
VSVASSADRIHRPAGSHLLADLSGIRADRLTDCDELEALLRSAAASAGARVLHSHFHGFGAGLGVTGVVLLAESHISIHTWPEDGFAAVDIFMCGASQPQTALDVIQQALAPEHCQLNTVLRALHN